MSPFDFAALLFSGPCNARCPFCIGKQIAPGLTPPNLHLYPPRNLEALTEAIQRYRIPRLVFTGTNTDPQMYAHEARLLRELRTALPGVHFSLHTNGRLALRKMAAFNAYDSVTLSFPAFDEKVYRRTMGVPRPPALERILRRARIPVKISIITTADTLPVLADTLTRLETLGVRRVALRKLYGDARPWERILPPEVALPVVGAYRGNPVCAFRGLEVTLWDFAASQSRSLNLFSSGVISKRYLLTEASPRFPFLWGSQRGRRETSSSKKLARM